MNESIVVTGWGMTTPLGADTDSTWTALRGGEDAFASIAEPGWDKLKAPRAARLKNFKAPEGLSRRDRSLQLGMAAAEEAWRQAELSKIPKDRIGTTFSSSKGGVVSLLTAQADPMEAGDFLADFFPHAAGQLLKQRLGFCGPTLCVSSACSTGLGSLAEGARLIRDGESDAVLAGSTESTIHPLVYAGFQNMGLLSRRAGGPSPFNSDRDGFLMGEGAAVMVLENETTARLRKAPLLARLSGWALGADATGYIDIEPQGGTIVAVIEKALRSAGLKPSDIGYVNAHGTGTKLNDEVESRALFQVFGDQKTWVSSTKGATGHLLGAAGSAEAVLAALVLSRGEIPDTRNLDRPDLGCRIRHVEKGGVRQKVEHVLSLSYGFGGQLAAVIFSKV
jgi:3-oxoacyl-[acyl-carrier-protein] synthase II